jgi:tetratricopeptide (TPR) repeat protein
LPARDGTTETSGDGTTDFESRFASPGLDNGGAGVLAPPDWVSGASDSTGVTSSPLVEAPGHEASALIDLGRPSAANEASLATAAASEAEETPAPDDYLGRLRLARRRRAAGRVEDALIEYRALLRDSTDSLDDLIHDLRDMSGETENPEVHRLLGDAYIREGNYVDALEAYNRALALSQDAPH